MITYQAEAWLDYAKDAPALWLECYEDHGNARASFQPDHAAYASIEQNGMLRILTARDDGVLIGYVIFVVHAHTHYAGLLCAYEDSFFLAKAHRKGITGARLIRESVRLLKAHGVGRIFFTTDAANSAGPFLERLGFEKSNTVYSLWAN